ncbi:LysR family transcriptional regulator [Vibrio sp. S4M6]|uniref:LysR family transcriptional regulator n=1 Tax=Vibrio sinus TaxID=2946865 RepID=UPI00202A6B81|nr:LysR family transcriptional regulator [Vibrio sinus]MCL9781687.1 LysR family transcriptional regulator [Vibrio sinus]
MFNPIWLNTFKTLVEIGHFTQTAEKLYMTQPGVSQHIKKLEQACGHVLMKRQKKGFELTEQGRIIYQYVLDQEKAQAHLLDQLNFDDPYSGSCLLSCSGALTLKLYPQLIELQKVHTELNVYLEAAPNHQILADVHSGQIDIGIVTHIPNKNLYQHHLLGYEELCLVLPKAYQNKQLSAQLLSQIGLIDHPDGKHYLSLYFGMCGNEELSNINVEDIPNAGYINQLHQILLPVSKGLGFTVLPISAIEAFPGQAKLHLAKAPKRVKEPLYLIQQRHRALPKRYDCILSILDSVLSSEISG